MIFIAFTIFIITKKILFFLTFLINTKSTQFITTNTFMCNFNLVLSFIDIVVSVALTDE